MTSLSDTAIDSSSKPLVGITIGGKYSVSKLIGSGGVGLVYLATQPPAAGEDEEVVVKVLAPNWAQDTESSARFQREASRLSTLRHPNIVRMLDHGYQGSQAYLVMEYCKGELLSEYVGRNRTLSLAQFVPIAAQLLKGIGHCHAREMMVRDIKPANVMLVERKGRANFVKMLDFGLAKLIEDDQPVTEEHVMGTVGYLSPEQIKGEDLDLRVDVYAVGVLFYFMLSGRLPFDGDGNPAVFYKTVNDPPPDLAEALPTGAEVPAALLALIHDCLQKDRELRPSDADAIVERLIDAVPAALFRLPRAESAARPRPGTSPGLDNSGRLDMGISVPPTSRNLINNPPTAPAAIMLSDGPMPSPRVSLPAMMGETPETAGPLTPIVVSEPVVVARAPARLKLLGASAAMLIGAMVAVSYLSQAAPADPAATAPIAVSGTDETAASLDRVAAQIAAGNLAEAGVQLDAIAGEVGADRAARGRVSRLQRDLKLERLMRTGASFEEQDNKPAALTAYRDALAVDTAFAPARAAITRIEGTRAPAGLADQVEGAEPTVAVAADPGALRAVAAITSTPAAALYIDGKGVGRTPFRGELTVGTHALEIRARGFSTWSGTIEVADKGTPPIAVALRKRRSPRGSGRAPTTAPPSAVPDPVPSSDKPAPSSDKPAPSSDTPAPAASKPSPFLPTDKGGKSSVFLPTRD